MNTGRFVILGLTLGALIFGAALWWFQTYAFYRTVEGLTKIEIDGRVIEVSGYSGIDADTSPLKMRACFRMDPEDATGPTPASPTPLRAPGWFDCFDHAEITRALEAGSATAILAAQDEFDCTERMIAVYPDGRAYMWRQMNEQVEKLNACVPPDLLRSR